MTFGDVYADGVEGVIKHRPTPWRDTSLLLRTVFFHKALTLSKHAYSVTLILSPELQGKLIGRGENGWMLQRAAIDERFRRTLGYRPSYWLVMEQSDRGKLHLHGAINVPELELAKMKAALLQAGGRVESKRAARQLKVKRCNAGDIVAFYSAKSFLPRGGSELGYTLTRTNDIGRTAQRCYEGERAAFAEIRKLGLWGDVLVAARCSHIGGT